MWLKSGTRNKDNADNDSSFNGPAKFQLSKQVSSSKTGERELIQYPYNIQLVMVHVLACTEHRPKPDYAEILAPLRHSHPVALLNKDQIFSGEC